MRNGGTIRRVGSGVLLASVLVTGLIAGAAAAPAAASSSAGAAACSCGEQRSAADQRQRADVVFEGTLEGSTSSVSTDENGKVTESGLVHQFAPSQVHKGSVQDPQYVVELPDRPCDLGLSGPGPYLVVAERPSRVEQKKYGLNPDDLIAHPCGGTRVLPADQPAPASAPEPAPAPPKGSGSADSDSNDSDDSVDPGSGEGLTLNRLLGDTLGDLLGGLLDALGLGSDDAPRPARS
ncbi:hypothetical protein GCM10009547_49130 [Sporichthya brevicatena]|uniref:Secreted protein n=1 Tax=Sporichthya brevicatena TaxID=171442 RepID=A0ABN1HD78_9ACTN